VIASARTAAEVDQRFPGVYPALVEDPVDPDGLNRVLVKLPWYAKGYLVWARVCQIYAAKELGATWLPDKDSEVLVAFAHGDMRWPFVIGSLHGHVDKPPVARTKTSDVRMLKTRAGSELTFDETNKTIVLKTKAGASIKLDEDGGAVTVEGKTKIELKAPTITINGTSEVNVTGGTIKLNS
jgi:uncharacterized protein involved in type VI secretion and phage assembly